MKRRSPLPRSIHRTASAAASTGEHCPATGWWIPRGSTEPGRYLSEGSEPLPCLSRGGGSFMTPKNPWGLDVGQLTVVALLYRQIA